MNEAPPHEPDTLLTSIDARVPDITGKSKLVWFLDDDWCLIELVPSLSSFTFKRYEHMPGTDALRLDFYEVAAEVMKKAGLPCAFEWRVDATRYVARRCDQPPFEVIVKNVAQGSTTRKYPGLFAHGHVFDPPVVKFDFRIDPEDQPIADDYVRAAGWPPEEMKNIALLTNRALRDWLAPRTLLDFCIVIGRDRSSELTVLSEVSPDCMRLRSPEGDPLDKDLFRFGASNEEVIQVWSRLVTELVRAPLVLP